MDFSPSSYHVNLRLTFASPANFSYISLTSDLTLLYFWIYVYNCLNRVQDLSTNLFSKPFFIFLLFLAHILEYDILNFQITSQDLLSGFQ